jgi:hypothetical protein
MPSSSRLIATLLILTAFAAGCSDPPPRHAVLIVIDTLRDDMLEAAATPHLDGLAGRGQRPAVTWSSGTWTVPSVISIFTGRHVRQHGWDELPGPQAVPPIPAVPTLAEVLSAEGFATAGLYANPILGRNLGFRRGFDRWERHADAALPGRAAQEIATWNDGRRHFLYLHLMGPHAVLAPSAGARIRAGLTGDLAGKTFSLRWARRQHRRSPESSDRAIDLYRRAYRAVIEDTDARIGQILSSLEPYREETAIVVTSDHGEMLGEAGRFGHTSWIDEPLTRIPLIAVGTRAVPERMTLASLADLITSALGIEARWPVRAGDPGLLVSQGAGKLALSTDGKTKGVWRKSGRLSVVDVTDYPDERRGPGALRDALEAERARFESEARPVPSTPDRLAPDPQALEALRELGYLDDAEPR